MFAQSANFSSVDVVAKATRPKGRKGLRKLWQKILKFYISLPQGFQTLINDTRKLQVSVCSMRVGQKVKWKLTKSSTLSSGTLSIRLAKQVL